MGFKISYTKYAKINNVKILWLQFSLVFFFFFEKYKKAQKSLFEHCKIVCLKCASLNVLPEFKCTSLSLCA